MKIEILGTGCAKCQELMANVNSVVAEKGVDAEIVKVQDMDKITDYGVMMTPALVIDGEVKSAGKLLTKEDIKALL